jgi:hypothetical protein
MPRGGFGRTPLVFVGAVLHLVAKAVNEMLNSAALLDSIGPES